jgi:hypothetical protein
MPRDAHSAAKAVDLLDLLIEIFDDGDHWIKGKLDDGAGNRCLVGAARHSRRAQSAWCADPPLPAEGDAAIPQDRMDWTDFVQRPVQGFRRTARGNLQARKLAVTDIEKHQRAVPTSKLLAA